MSSEVGLIKLRRTLACSVGIGLQLVEWTVAGPLRLSVHLDKIVFIKESIL